MAAKVRQRERQALDYATDTNLWRAVKYVGMLERGGMKRQKAVQKAAKHYDIEPVRILPHLK